MKPPRSLRSQVLNTDNNNGLGSMMDPSRLQSLPPTSNPSETSLELYHGNTNRRIQVIRIGASAVEGRPTSVNTAAPVLPFNNQVNTFSTYIDRQPTLFTKNASTGRKMAELKVVLGKEPSGRLQANAKALPLSPQDSESAVALEQAKTRARIKLDLLLESGVCVEGGYLKGKVIVNVRPPMNKDGLTFLGQGKVRVVGFEAIPHNDLRFTFYHCGAMLDDVSPFSDSLYNSPEDATGFRLGRIGRHILPFAMRLPPRHPDAPVAKGVYESRTSGSSIRYIAMISIKVKDVETGQTSIAHFYRYLELWPLLDPLRSLAPSPTPIYATTSKSVFLGGSGTIKLTASIHRETWVAGQKCFVKVFIANDTERKRVQSLTLSLIRTETMFIPDLDAAIPEGTLIRSDSDACRTSTTKRVIARSTLEMGETAISRHVTAVGWWTGVPPSSALEFNHSILIPPLALTIPRSRLLEVGFALDVRVGTGTLSSEVFVILPIRVVNYISLDPLPAFGPPEKLGTVSDKTNVSFVVQRPPSLTQIVARELIFSRSRAQSEPLQPPTLPYVSMPNGTYRGSAEMPRTEKLQVCNRTSQDMSLSISGFHPPSIWIDKSPHEQTPHAIQESDDGLVEPERPPSQSDLLAMLFGVTHTPEAPGVSRQANDRVAATLVQETKLQHEACLSESDQFERTESDVPANTPTISECPVLLPLLESSPTRDSHDALEENFLFECNEEDIASSFPSRRGSTDTMEVPVSGRPFFTWSDDTDNFSTASKSQGSSAMTTPNESKIASTRRPLPQRPRPHPIFMARSSGSRASVLPLDLSPSKKTTIRESADLFKSDLLVTEINQDVALQNIVVKAKESAEIVSSTSMNEVPTTVSALMRQDLDTPILPSYREQEIKGPAVFERSFATSTRPARTQEMKRPPVTLSSIKARIAMFEQRAADEATRTPPFTVHAPSQRTRGSVGDPLKSKRLW
ncbi:SubName: Full=Uncharacterized protein {ECO:0000313/EMBL:CCA67155.1} [Serendipita indica DSM 11827]|nr:SubName: Full=Uncharacterized protein {ECO:0000313/EMBL:CCA67155.1} [Serendipita indica DSM 11827]